MKTVSTFVLVTGLLVCCAASSGLRAEDAPFVVPPMTELPAGEKPFTFTDVGAKIPNYTAGESWGTQGDLKNLMQNPLPPAASAERYVTPQGMQVKLWASETDLGGKPIAMTWDARGRLWVCETMDYPNELQSSGRGRDRIRICEDTDHDGVADKFTLFAEGLSIPTTLVCYGGGVIVQNGPETIFLKDVDGDDKADFRQSLITGWALGDTHGGVSNFQYGLDNWIWGMQGYNASTPVINGQAQQGFRQGFWRFRVTAAPGGEAAPIGSDNADRDFSAHTLRVEAIEFLRATNNNTWGLGISEDGLIFGSTANHNPSNFMTIPNRYYERVRGWSPSTLQMISDTYKFSPITPNVRQVDHHGGYTAGAGHSIYTARKYPQSWWNRTAFVCGPTGHLVGTFVLTPEGAGFKSTSPFNLLASDDEWAAPIMAETGPDGFVWVLDWYNYIVQHNPTPHGFETGKGNAYETDLRDKRHGRVYRVTTTDDANDDPVVRSGLADANGEQLVAALTHPTMLWRRQAQRVLVEAGKPTAQVIDGLLELLADQRIDAIELNVGAIHALWTLDGLGLIGGDNRDVDMAVRQALSHPSAGVRRSAVQVLGGSTADVAALIQARVLVDADPQVKLAALLKVADLPDAAGSELVLGLVEVADSSARDKWLLDAWTSAAAIHGKQVLPALLAAADDAVLPASLQERLAVVSEHVARAKPSADTLQAVLRAVAAGNTENSIGVLRGLAAGWQKDYWVELNPQSQTLLVELFDRLPVDQQSQLVQLAHSWGATVLGDKVTELVKSLLKQVEDETQSDQTRIASAQRLVAMQPSSSDVAADLLDTVTPQTTPAVAMGVIGALRSSRSADIGQALIDKAAESTPAIREAMVRVLLAQPATTMDLMSAIAAGDLRISDLTLDQRQALSNHPDKSIRMKAKQLLASTGGIPTADRVELLRDWLPITKQQGSVAAGQKVFKQHCATCHRHGSEGANVGPDLTGMAVHPKQELLTHILDPNQSVEGNFRTFTLLTVEGMVINGMLGGESRTSIELIDTQGKRHTVLREDIEQLNASNKSLMPEGFESQITQPQMADLLEFLTARGKYVPLSFSGVATAVSTRGMFGDTDDGPDRIVFADWQPQTFAGVPFNLVDPQDGRVPNVILLNGPRGSKPPTMPKQVSLVCNAPAAAIHILGGVSGWGFPFSREETLSATVRLHYQDGQVEDHPLRNGVHFADYIRRVDVPGSEFAVDVQGRQVRYLKLLPQRTEPLKTIELIKGDDGSAPIFVAITVESP